MSQLLRHRGAAAAVAMLFAAGPLLLTGAAYAQSAPGGPVQESGAEVVFSGDGILSVTCGSVPNVGSVAVPAETTLRVVNQTGQRARLLLDGSAQGEIANNSSADVLFHRGPVELALKPLCVLADESPVRVEVLAAPRAPAPPAARPTGTATTPNRPAAAPTAGNPGDTRNPVATSSPRNSARTPGATASPDDQASPDGTEETPAPTDAPAVPVGGGQAAPGAGTVDSVPGDGLAAEPTASVEPIQNNGPIGLLALIATICIIGVSAGAIRAIVSQRATRASLA